MIPPGEHLDDVLSAYLDDDLAPPARPHRRPRPFRALSRPTRLLAAAGLTVWGVVSGPAPAVEAAASPGAILPASTETDAVELLDRAREAADTQTFTGTVVVEWR